MAVYKDRLRTITMENEDACLVGGNDKTEVAKITTALKKVPIESISAKTLRAMLLQTLSNSTTLMQAIIMSGSSNYISSEIVDTMPLRRTTGRKLRGGKFFLLLCYLFCVNFFGTF